jgi:uncharacterized protein (DUF305 family)
MNNSSLTKWLWPSLAVVLALVAAVFAALWWQSRPPADNDPAVTFARDMTAHHTQAVEIAAILRDRTSDTEMRQVLIDVILTQQAQIGQMQGWLQVWGLPYSGENAPMTGMMEHNGEMMTMTPAMMGMASQEDVNALSALPVPEAEIKFLQVMIKHHQGGVLMAEDVLKHTARPEVVRLAQSIITAQTSEIAYMQDQLRQRGVEP